MDDMPYVKLARVSEFGGARLRCFRILARPVGIVRNPDGSFYAIELSCKHANANLGDGRLVGDIVTCPMHGWQYDIRTGKCVHGGNDACLRRHGLRVQGDEIWVSLRPLPTEPG